jgi:murein DD-endopeptidase MepM/ murein hydrolase activator NlpD
MRRVLVAAPVSPTQPLRRAARTTAAARRGHTTLAMPSRRQRYRGRHAARRRHLAAPFLITGLLVSTTATIGLPQTAQALDGSRALEAGAVRVAATPFLERQRREQEPSRSGERTALVTSAAAVVPGQRLAPKPPPPWVLPVRGYHLTARFGQVSGLWSHFHTGLDFAAPSGTEIRSIAPGVVQSTGYDGAYGNKTQIRLEDGTVLWYCHQTSYVVHPGERVATGQLIGYVGSTGNVTGPHLHLEVHPHGGPPIDPERWLPEHHLHP